MAATTTKIGIINRGLQLLGQPEIASLNENSRGAKAMRRCYDQILLAQLRANVWTFAVKRASLAADASSPIFGKKRYFPLPGDYVRTAPNETTYCNTFRRDWEIEGLNVVSDDKAPLPFRYVSSSITESNFDALFAEVMSASLAMAACEELTNSNSKKADAQAVWSESIRQAKKINAIEKAPVKSPTCSFITVRY